MTCAKAQRGSADPNLARYCGEYCTAAMGDHEFSYKTAALQQPGQIPGALRSEMFLTSFCDSIDDPTMTDWTLEVSHVIQEQDNLCVRTCL